MQRLRLAVLLPQWELVQLCGPLRLRGRSELRRGRRLPVTGEASLALWARALAVGSLLHAALPDFETEGWGLPQGVEIVGAMLLLWRPHLLGFLLTAVSMAYPLLFLRDVMTQSLYLLIVSLIGAVSAFYRTEAASSKARMAVTGTTSVIYATAAVHKLNTDFFNPEISCAHHAYAQFLDYLLPSAWVQAVGVPGASLSGVVVLVELLLAVLVWRRHPARFVVALLFHLPLTLTLAPAFGAVIFSGHVASLRARELVVARQWVSDRRGTLLAAAGFGLALNAACAGARDFATVPIWCVLDAERLTRALQASAAGPLIAVAIGLLRGARPTPNPPMSALVSAPAVLFVLHGLLPYTGLAVQHTAAMLSNLRVDPSCHNSLIFPEALRVRDGYVYLTVLEFAGGQRPARSALGPTTLWNIAALYAMRENWCVDHLRPIHVAGRWRGQDFDVADLCGDLGTALPKDVGWPPAELFPSFQAFQKNLPRACFQPCVH